MKVNETKGKLVIIGGGEDKKGDCVILKEFVHLAGAAKARIAIMTVATDTPEEYANEYKKVFKRLGVECARAVDVSRRKDVHDPKALEIIKQATGIFFTGGDQLHITSLMGGTEMQELIREMYEQGAVLGGTSAGAAMMSNSMIIRGESNCSPRFGGMDIGPGMDFLRDTMIDTHFSQRGRIGRLLTAIAHYPQDLGFGIDEDTALVVSDGKLEVIGENTVTVIDAGGITYTNLPDLGGLGHEKPLTQIKIDEIMTAYLCKAGLSLNDVPPVSEIVFLRESINLSTGGTAKDVTDVVHPEVVEMCERATRIVGMDICGIDLVMRDIAAPVERSGVAKQGGGIIELNAAPGLRMHLYPSEGKPRDVGGAIIEMLYPAGSDGRIPIISITGTNGKTTVTRMIGHVLAHTGQMVGMTTTDGIYLGDKRIVEGDTTGPHSARTVLSDPAVEVALLETARGGIIRRGLGYDWSDISVMTNIAPDHIGQDGIKSIEDLVYIKSLIAERVREGGTLILNADDEHLARLMENPRVSGLKKRVVYFSLHENNPLITRHTAAGNTAYFLRDGMIIEVSDWVEIPVLRVADIPCTMDGTAEFQISNLLAAIAACRAYGITGELLAASLRSFNSTDNPGRANLYRVKSGYVMVDYGHNADAFAAVCRMAARWNDRRVTGIIGVPGDRDDSLIEQAGRVAARGFHRVIIKEDKDLRGRESGKVARLLCQTVNDESPDTECHIVLDEVEALRFEIEQMQAGQVIVVFYDELEPVMELLESVGAMPIQAISEANLTRAAQESDTFSMMGV